MQHFEKIKDVYLNRCIYYYDFDLITGIVESDIIDKDGNNYTKELGLVSPCTFDELIDRSYDENYFGIWHVADDGVNTLSQKSLLDAYNKGRNLIEAFIYIPDKDKYYRINYIIIKDDYTGNPHTYVYCIDSTHEEKSRDKVFGELRHEKDDIEDIVESAELGIWHIYLFDGVKPRMKGTLKMKELLGVKNNDMSEEELYDFWYSKVKKSSIPSVVESVNEMIKKGFSENEYHYLHPDKGEIIVRCGGSSKKVEGKGYILRGYHSDVTEIVKAYERQKHQLRDALDEVEIKEKQLLQKNRELEDINENQYSQLQEIASLNEMLKFQQETRNELHAVLESMAAIFYSLHEVDLINDTVTEFSARYEVKEIVSHKHGAREMMTQVISAVVKDEFREEALIFTDLNTIKERMRDKQVISGEFIGNRIGWFLALFVVMERDGAGNPAKVVFSTRIIDEEKKKSEKLIRKIQTDELTGLFNRRAYEKDIYVNEEIPQEDEYIYVSLDLNGLKTVNDTLGHTAGDELIIGACECMKKVFLPHGKLYRIGGDEFVAILYVNREKLAEMFESFDNEVANWSGKLIKSFTISYGYVSKDDFPNESVRKLALRADKKMYEAKAEHYRKLGFDRRGQQDAHRALCALYTKILRINLTEDSYQIVNMDESEKTSEKGFSDKISSWLKAFGETGQVHSADLAEYFEKTDIGYMKEYFKTNKTSLQIFYRRKYNEIYKQVMMEIIPADDYLDDNQSLFLYVKNIDK